MLVVEGAMGLYDGGGAGGGCTAQLAALLGLPVLLILNAHGLGQSVAALAEGFLRHCPPWAAVCGRPAFAGMVCTHVGGERHGDLLREALAPLEKTLNVPLLGLLPRAGAPRLAAGTWVWWKPRSSARPGQAGARELAGEQLPP